MSSNTWYCLGCSTTPPAKWIINDPSYIECWKCHWRPGNPITNAAESWKCLGCRVTDWIIEDPEYVECWSCHWRPGQSIPQPESVPGPLTDQSSDRPTSNTRPKGGRRDPDDSSNHTITQREERTMQYQIACNVSKAVTEQFGGASAQNIGVTNIPNFLVQRANRPATQPYRMTAEILKKGTQNRQSKVKSDGTEKREREHSAKSGYSPDPRTSNTPSPIPLITSGGVQLKEVWRTILVYHHPLNTNKEAYLGKEQIAFYPLEPLTTSMDIFIRRAVLKTAT